ncbi:DsbA family protein [Ruania zhangjianzhongii]|uniref:DsbA family oxidoreductase n=1 Tax=Ruania zhangjianzhongii TaxID=2603206 RepID=UPI0011CC3433|nr:DsbA family oxidoreductase [Ruania zhangjianzhongii]
MTIAASAPVQVEIRSDPQCVWCFIAHPRFEKAVAAFEGMVEVTYRSFELRPDAQVEIDKEQQIAQHAGANLDRVTAVNAQLTELARAEGISYRPDLTRPTNSRLALELLHHANETGYRAALTHRLSTAYFTEGRHIGDIDELPDLAHEVGLNREKAREALTDRRYRDAVDQDSDRLRALGARGVPLYVIDGQWGISGAQSVQTYLNALKKAVDA